MNTKGETAMKEFYPTKRIYVVIDTRGRVVSSFEQSLNLPRDWKCYLKKRPADRACVPEKTREEELFLAQWRGKEGYDLVVGIADSLESLVSSIPEIARRYSTVVP